MFPETQDFPAHPRMQSWQLKWPEWVLGWALGEGRCTVRHEGLAHSPPGGPAADSDTQGLEVCLSS